jgi:hypothetical protein
VDTLAFEDENEAAQFCTHHGLSVEGGCMQTAGARFIHPENVFPPKRAIRVIESKQNSPLCDVSSFRLSLIQVPEGAINLLCRLSMGSRFPKSHLPLQPQALMQVVTSKVEVCRFMSLNRLLRRLLMILHPSLQHLSMSLLHPPSLLSSQYSTLMKLVLV